jgi:hypothetical protein
MTPLAPAPAHTFHPDKLRAAVHYVCFRSPDPRRLGKTKLNKILYYADREAYLRTGDPITGERYVKHQYGPVSSHLDETLRGLEKDRLIAIADASGYNAYVGASYAQKQFVALRRPDVSLFTAEEVSLIEQYVDVICNQHSARSISDMSHDVVWEAAEIGEEIPSVTAFLQPPAEITPADVAWARAALSA